MRDELSAYLELPKGISSNAFLDCINAIFECDEFIEAVKQWQKNKRDVDKK